jgi:bifunctional DNA primase/polymerase-like protein
MADLFVAARRLVASGLSVVPVRLDGSKAAAIPWKPYQHRHPTPAELSQWLRYPLGLAVIAGSVSGNVEILDFDAPEVFALWCAMVEEHCPGLLKRLPMVVTPRAGRHCYFRCPVIAGNRKLAQRLGADGRPETLIETRGEGGYAIVPPSPPTCHPLKRPYVLEQGELTAIPHITPAERAILLTTACRFNTYVRPAHVIRGRTPQTPVSPSDERPGDHFNAEVTWAAVLEPHGWTRVGQRGEVTLWRRPGKRTPGGSATTNYAGSDLLYVFSSNAAPFDPEHAYSKFAAYALLAHGGDWQAASKALYRQGYRPPRSGPSPAGYGTTGRVIGAWNRRVRRDRAVVL